MTLLDNQICTYSSKKYNGIIYDLFLVILCGLLKVGDSATTRILQQTTSPPIVYGTTPFRPPDNFCSSSSTPAFTEFMRKYTNSKCDDLNSWSFENVCGINCLQACRAVLNLGTNPDSTYIARHVVYNCDVITDSAGQQTGLTYRVAVCCRDPNQCQSGEVYRRTGQITYTKPQNCDFIRMLSVRETCGERCQRECQYALQLPSLPSIEYIGSSTIATCQTTSVQGGALDTNVLTVDVCCRRPPESCPQHTTFARTGWVYIEQAKDVVNDCKLLNELSVTDVLTQCGSACVAECKTVLDSPIVDVISVKPSVCRSAKDISYTLGSGMAVQFNLCCTKPQKCGANEEEASTSDVPNTVLLGSENCAALKKMTARQLCLKAGGDTCGLVCQSALGLPNIPSLDYVAGAYVSSCEDGVWPKFESKFHLKLCCAVPSYNCNANYQETYARTDWVYNSLYSECGFQGNTATGLCSGSTHCQQACQEVLATNTMPDPSATVKASVSSCYKNEQAYGNQNGIVSRLEMCCRNKLTCPIGQQYKKTLKYQFPYLNCTSFVTAAVERCDLYCRQQCQEVLGLVDLPDLSVVGGAQLVSCEPAASQGVLVELELCCAIPEWSECQTGNKGETEYIPIPEITSCDDIKTQISDPMSLCSTSTHCRTACKNILQLRSMPSLEYVAFVNTKNCIKAASPATGVLIKLDICCKVPESTLCSSDSVHAVLEMPSTEVKDCSAAMATPAQWRDYCGDSCREKCMDMLSLDYSPQSQYIPNVVLQDCKSPSQIDSTITAGSSEDNEKRYLSFELCCSKNVCHDDSAPASTEWIHASEISDCQQMQNTGTFNSLCRDNKCVLACQTALGLTETPDAYYVDESTVSECHKAPYAGYSGGVVYKMDLCCKVPESSVCTSVDVEDSEGWLEVEKPCGELQEKYRYPTSNVDPFGLCKSNCLSMCQIGLNVNLTLNMSHVMGVEIAKCELISSTRSKYKLDVCCQIPHSFCPETDRLTESSKINLESISTCSEAYAMEDQLAMCGDECMNACKRLLGTSSRVRVNIARIRDCRDMSHQAMDGYTKGVLVKFDICCEVIPDICPADAIHAATSIKHDPAETCNQLRSQKAETQLCGVESKDCIEVCQENGGSSVTKTEIDWCRELSPSSPYRNYTSGVMYKYDICCHKPQTCQYGESTMFSEWHFDDELACVDLQSLYSSVLENRCGKKCIRQCIKAGGLGTTLSQIIIDTTCVTLSEDISVDNQTTGIGYQFELCCKEKALGNSVKPVYILLMLTILLSWIIL